MVEKEIKFEYINFLSRESLKLYIQIDDDGSIYGNAEHLLPAKFGGHPKLDLPEDLNMDKDISIIDQREISYRLYSNKENIEFLKIWLDNIKTIDLGTPIINDNYMYTTDGTYGTLTLVIGENEMKIGLRNFEVFDKENLFLWISELINHFGINSKKLFGIE